MKTSHKGYNLGEGSKKVECPRNVCWYCGGTLCWESDFNYDEIFNEGEGVVSYLHCMNCGADVQYSLREDNDE